MPDLVYRACLSFLADSPARLLLVNMEDLWLETEQQNVPGVVEGHPNWQRKGRLRYLLEDAGDGGVAGESGGRRGWRMVGSEVSTHTGTARKAKA